MSNLLNRPWKDDLPHRFRTISFLQGFRGPCENRERAGRQPDEAPYTEVQYTRFARLPGVRARLAASAPGRPPPCGHAADIPSEATIERKDPPNEALLRSGRLLDGAAHRPARGGLQLRPREGRHPEQEDRLRRRLLEGQSEGLRAGAAARRRAG